jgi:adenylate kinase
MPAARDRAAWLKGPAFECSEPPAPVARAWRLILLGAPGVGKGTQAELLSHRLHACHLSTGDVFRAAKGLIECDRSPAMNAALDFMRRGELVPDETVLDMIRERVGCLTCGGGFLLDGFPRTVAQAAALQKILEREAIQLNAVISYELPLPEIVARLSGRRTCANCKTVFHIITRPPQTADVCDQCHGPLIQREDDRPESIRVRMAAYEASTAPLVEYYRRRHLLVPIAATGAPEEILQRTLAALS